MLAPANTTRPTLPPGAAAGVVYWRAGEPWPLRWVEGTLDGMRCQHLAGSEPESTALDQRVGGPTGALDRPIRFARKSITPRALFDGLRAAGFRPHRHGEDDQRAAKEFAGRVNFADSGAESGIGLGEEAVAADAFFGVTEALFAPSGKDNESTTRMYGTDTDTLDDILHMGAGRVRRLKKSDLYWGSLFPLDPSDSSSFQDGVRVYSPSSMATAIARDGYAALSQFTNLLCLAAARGIKVNVMPFNPGGGAPLTVQATTDDTAELNDASGDPVGVTVNSIMKARPSHQNGVVVSSTQGWDPFYWDDTRADWPSSALSGTTHGADEIAYQKYCLNVWPTDTDVVGKSYTSASGYMLECARRKSLGIAAFSDAIATYLAGIDAVFTGLSGSSLKDVIDVFELGNELDLTFQDLNEYGLEEDATLNEYGAREAGRFFALLAGPIRNALPWARFKVNELATAPGKTEFQSRCKWLKNVVELGMVAELAQWKQMQDFWTLLEWAVTNAPSMGPAGTILLTALQNLGNEGTLGEWIDSSAAAGYAWPPTSGTLGISIGDLVHQFGLHWFNVFDTGTTGVALVQSYDSYRSDVVLGLEVPYLYDAVLAPLASTLGLSFSVSDIHIGAMGMPAFYPPALRDLASQYTSAYCSYANEAVQASAAARWTALLAAVGAGSACWFTFLLDYINGEWIEAWGSKYKTMSLHNDVLGPGDRQVAAETACRRPAWYTLKRMNLILSQAKDVELLHSSQGAVVIRFTARRGFQLDGMIRSWAYLTMAWVDAYADKEQGKDDDGDGVFRWETQRATDLELELATGEYVPGYVVPTVTPAGSGTTDGFLAVSEVSWDVADAAAVSGTGPFRFVVGRMDPAFEPAPTCIFSDEPVDVVSP